MAILSIYLFKMDCCNYVASPEIITSMYIFQSQTTWYEQCFDAFSNCNNNL